MKKLMAVAFVVSLAAVSCGSKNEDKESNIMLPEPKVEAMDSSSVVKPADNMGAVQDSTIVKADTVK